MRNPARGNPVFAGLMGQIDNCTMLIAFVQGVVGPFNEDLRPLQDRGGEKPRKRAENDLMEKSGMHLDTL